MSYFATTLHELSPILSGHNTFPLRYGWLKKVYNHIEANPDVANVFGQDTAIADFGVGKNMLSALRFWSMHTGMVIKEGKRYRNTTPQDGEGESFSSINAFYNARTLLSIDGLDPYLESPSSAWLLHLYLATNPDLITYYWFFNLNNKSAFQRDELVRSISTLMADYGLKVPSPNTIKRDVDTMVQTYAPRQRNRGNDIEDAITGPLVDLGLITTDEKMVYAQRGAKQTLSLAVFVYALVQFWQKHHASAGTLPLEVSTYAECSPGRVFLIDEEAIITYAEQLETAGYTLSWVQSAGIRQFQVRNDSSLASVGEQAIAHMKATDYVR